MNTRFETKELDIVLVAKSHNPSVLNPDFLKYNSIVPNDWVLKGTPLCIEPMARVEFQNGISITAQPERVIFHQILLNREAIEKTVLPQIVHKYVENLPHVIYTAIGINPRGHLLFDSKEDCESYISEKFIKSGSWSTFKDSKHIADISFSYVLETRKTLKISIKNAFFNDPTGQKTPAVVFSSNFHHVITGDNRDERLGNIHRIIDNWRVDKDTYIDFIKAIDG